jgi:hypothetical protein
VCGATPRCLQDESEGGRGVLVLVDIVQPREHGRVIVQSKGRHACPHVTAGGMQ